MTPLLVTTNTFAAAAPHALEPIARAALHSKPICSVVVQDRAVAAYSKTSSPPLPHAIQASGRAAGHSAPACSIVMQDSAMAAHSKDVTAAAAPHAFERIPLRQRVLPTPSPASAVAAFGSAINPAHRTSTNSQRQEHRVVCRISLSLIFVTTGAELVQCPAPNGEPDRERSTPIIAPNASR